MGVAQLGAQALSGVRVGQAREAGRPGDDEADNADLARELVAAKAHIAELEAARPHHIEQSAVDLTVARRSYLALVPKPAAEAWAELVTMLLKKRFSQCCEECSTCCRQAWPPLAHHVRR